MEIEVSPRISFSNDPCPSPSFSSSSLRIERTIETISSEFDFSTSYEVSYSTPADLLFSQGKLLPLNNSSPIPKQDQTVKQILSRKLDDSDRTRTFWRDNSLSVSVAGSKNKEGPTALPFQRSKSDGCTPNNYQKSYKSYKSSSNSANGKAYYYSRDRILPCKNGVRINPVINVPATFIPIPIPRGGSAGSSSTSSGSNTTTATAGGSFFAYLLCNCRDKNMEMDDNEGV